MFFRLLANHSPLRQCDPLPNHASLDQGSARASSPEQSYGHRASPGTYHILKTCAVASLTSRYRTGTHQAAPQCR